MVRAGPDDQQRRVDDPAEEPAVGEPEHRRAVEDDPVVMVREGQQELPELQRAQDLDRRLSRVAGRDEVEVRDAGVAERALPGDLAAEDVHDAQDRPRVLILDEDFGQAGRRKSISSSKVRSPASAQVAARFSAVVLFPSPALALVTSRVTIGPVRSATPSRLARMLR